MHIVLVTITYPPEIRAISFMMQELAEELALRGYKVTVITSQPKTYLTDELSQKSYKELSVENGIQVIRVKTLHFHKDNYLIRGISEISLPFLFYAKIKKYIKEKIDSIKDRKIAMKLFFIILVIFPPNIIINIISFLYKSYK